MKRTRAVAMAVSLFLAAGCAASPSSDRYIGADADSGASSSSKAPAATHDVASTQATRAPASESAQPPAAVPTQSASPNNAPTVGAKPSGGAASASAAASGARKSAAAPPPAKEAQKNNAAANKAVVGSIMDKSRNEADAKPTAETKLTKAIENLRALAKDLKAATEDGDAKKIADLASQIGTAWTAMQDSVGASYPEMKDFLQGKIDGLSDLVGGDPLDLKALLRLDYELYQAVRQLADKAG